MAIDRVAMGAAERWMIFAGCRIEGGNSKTMDIYDHSHFQNVFMER